MKSTFTFSHIALNPADIIILFLACVLTIWLYAIFWFTNHTSGAAEIVVVQVAEHGPKEYSLKTNQIIDIKGHIGQSLIEIKQGKARFIHSACRNQFCVFHGWLSTPGDTTACLPNRVSITLKGNLSEYDALAGGQ